MGDTNIEWTQRPGTRGVSWNPVEGCTRCSPGCEHCYAEAMAGRFSGPGQWAHDVARLKLRVIDGDHERLEGRWTGVVRLRPHKLADPLRWREPRTVFVNSMSDLFHEKLTNEEIAAVFGVMAATPQHTYIVLTKRAARLPEWFAWIGQQDPEPWTHAHAAALAVEARLNGDLAGKLHSYDGGGSDDDRRPWPLPNVWLGVSAERQEELDERWPHLARTPAAVRFLSLEPLLGPIDLGKAVGRPHGAEYHDGVGPCTCHRGERVDWVIAGGESGIGARACDVGWITSIVEQCKAAGVPIFVKQLGARPYRGTKPDATLGLPEPVATECVADWEGSMRIGVDPGWMMNIRDRKGGNIHEWPPALRVRDFPR